MKRGSAEESDPRPRIEIEEAVRRAASIASDRKAEDLVVLDLRKIASFTEFFVICSGRSTRQVQAIADAVEEDLRAAGKRPLHIEGYSNGEWILLDYGDFIVHVFSPQSRRFYDLERLWRDADRVDVNPDA